MLIDQKVMEAMIIFLYKTREFEACMELIKVYNKYMIQKSLFDDAKEEF